MHDGPYLTLAEAAELARVSSKRLRNLMADGTLREPTTLVADAHKAGLLVHVWTLRSEPAFLSPSYGGDPIKEYRQFAALGVDGIFGDFPDVAFAALRK